MPTSSSSRVPGELSLKSLALTIVAFLVVDLAAYLGFSNLFARTQQSAPQNAVDQKIVDLEHELAIIEQHLIKLDAKGDATKPLDNKAPQGSGTAKDTGVSRREFERLRCEIRRLEQKCCGPPRPCEP